jgi:hypothetical protein
MGKIMKYIFEIIIWLILIISLPIGIILWILLSIWNSSGKIAHDIDEFIKSKTK